MGPLLLLNAASAVCAACCIQDCIWPSKHMRYDTLILVVHDATCSHHRALSELPQAEVAAAAASLHGRRCVWVGAGFAPATKVAFHGTLDLSPWLFVLPAELAPFKDLLAMVSSTHQLHRLLFTCSTCPSQEYS